MKKHLSLIFIMALIQLGASGCSQDVGFAEVDPAAAAKTASESFDWTNRLQKVDVLVVVDNSFSMVNEQRKLAEKFGSFLSKLNDVDWQLGITTTDVSDGKYGLKGDLLPIGQNGERFLHSESANPNEQFKRHIQRKESSNCAGNCPSPSEQPLKAIALAASKHNTSNKGFFRNEAQLAVIVISDEDEMSNGPAKATKPVDVINSAKLHLGANKDLTGYGIVIQPWDRDCLDEKKENSVAHYGQHVQDLADMTGGLTGSLCDSDYADTLAVIGQDTNDKLRAIKIRYFPTPGTVKVQFIPDHQTEWRIEAKHIYFENPPPNGTKILVEYEKPSYGG